MFWGHDGELFAKVSFTNILLRFARDMGDVKTHFWNLKSPFKSLLRATEGPLLF